MARRAEVLAGGTRENIAYGLGAGPFYCFWSSLKSGALLMTPKVPVAGHHGMNLYAYRPRQTCLDRPTQ